MTYRRTVVWGLLAALAAGGLVWLLRRPTDEQRISKRLRSLAACVTKEAGEGNSVMVLKTQRLSTLFDDTCDLQISEYDLSGTLSAEAIASHAARARATCTRLTLRFHDVNVRIVEPDRAVVTLTAHLAADSHGRGRADEIAEIQCRLREREEAWVFTHFRDVQVLRR